MPKIEAEYFDMATDCYTMTDSGSVKSIVKRRATLALMCAYEECRDSWPVFTTDTNIVALRIAPGVLRECASDGPMYRQLATGRVGGVMTIYLFKDTALS